MQIITKVLPFVQIGISALLVVTILLQQSDAGLGGAFGGGDGTVTYHTKRGFEKVLFITTIVLGVLFFLSAFIAVLL